MNEIVIGQTMTGKELIVDIKPLESKIANLTTEGDANNEKAKDA